MSDIFEKEFAIPVQRGHENLITYFGEFLKSELDPDQQPIRFVIWKTDEEYYHCDVGCLQSDWRHGPIPAVFGFRRRGHENAEVFNIALVIPTGVGAEFGGHAGDSAPVAQLFGSVCDRLVTHPNVVNASDINEMPPNTFYVEGSVLSRLLMGTVGLQAVRSNRVLTILEDHKDSEFIDQAVNAINAARACYGLDCEKSVVLSPSFQMWAFDSKNSGRAIGKVKGMNNLFAAMEAYQGEYDAVALASIIRRPVETHTAYFTSGGEMVNPWGGVEAMLTHTLSQIYGVPTAHGPITESDEHEDITGIGVTDSRMAAEIISTSYMQCVFKGLQRSPRVVTDPVEMAKGHTMTAEDISLLVVPDGCLGLPVLAAIDQGITVVAVRENRNVMQNTLEALPWAPGQFHVVDSYLEAVGIAKAMRVGANLASVRRPLRSTKVSLFMHDESTIPNNTIMDYYGQRASELDKFQEIHFDYEVEYADNPEFQDEAAQVPSNEDKGRGRATRPVISGA